MPPPSQLTIATSAVTRLRKEESSYYKELAEQEAQVQALEAQIKSGEGNEDGNGEFMLKQLKTVVEQTRAVFMPMERRIEEAMLKLEEQIALAAENGAPEAEIEKATAVLAEAKE